MSSCVVVSPSFLPNGNSVSNASDFGFLRSLNVIIIIWLTKANLAWNSWEEHLIMDRFAWRWFSTNNIMIIILSECRPAMSHRIIIKGFFASWTSFNQGWNSFIELLYLFASNSIQNALTNNNYANFWGSFYVFFLSSLLNGTNPSSLFMAINNKMLLIQYKLLRYNKLICCGMCPIKCVYL